MTTRSRVLRLGAAATAGAGAVTALTPTPAYAADWHSGEVRVIDGGTVCRFEANATQTSSGWSAQTVALTPSTCGRRAISAVYKSGGGTVRRLSDVSDSGGAAVSSGSLVDGSSTRFLCASFWARTSTGLQSISRVIGPHPGNCK